MVFDRFSVLQLKNLLKDYDLHTSENSKKTGKSFSCF